MTLFLSSHQCKAVMDQEGVPYMMKETQLACIYIMMVKQRVRTCLLGNQLLYNKELQEKLQNLISKSYTPLDVGAWEGTLQEGSSALQQFKYVEQSASHHLLTEAQT